jgi:hypothetical protein
MPEPSWTALSLSIGLDGVDWDLGRLGHLNSFMVLYEGYGLHNLITWFEDTEHQIKWYSY